MGTNHVEYEGRPKDLRISKVHSVLRTMIDCIEDLISSMFNRCIISRDVIFNGDTEYRAIQLYLI